MFFFSFDLKFSRCRTFCGGGRENTVLNIDLYPDSNPDASPYWTSVYLFNPGTRGIVCVRKTNAVIYTKSYTISLRRRFDAASRELGAIQETALERGAPFRRSICAIRERT